VKERIFLEEKKTGKLNGKEKSDRKKKRKRMRNRMRKRGVIKRKRREKRESE
jgi:hypothetical protein